jgi:hypothetical protein
MMPQVNPSPSQVPNSYFRQLLADGAKPFLYRSGIRLLLGVPESDSHSLAFSTSIPPVGFRYAHRWDGTPLAASPVPTVSPVSPKDDSYRVSDEAFQSMDLDSKPHKSTPSVPEEHLQASSAEHLLQLPEMVGKRETENRDLIDIPGFSAKPVSYPSLLQPGTQDLSAAPASILHHPTDDNSAPSPVSENPLHLQDSETQKQYQASVPGQEPPDRAFPTISKPGKVDVTKEMFQNGIDSHAKESSPSVTPNMSLKAFIREQLMRVSDVSTIDGKVMVPHADGLSLDVPDSLVAPQVDDYSESPGSSKRIDRIRQQVHRLNTNASVGKSGSSVDNEVLAKQSSPGHKSPKPPSPPPQKTKLRQGKGFGSQRFRVPYAFLERSLLGRFHLPLPH